MSTCNTLSSGKREYLNNLGDINCDGLVKFSEVIAIFEMAERGEGEVKFSDFVRAADTFEIQAINKINLLDNYGNDEDTTTPPITTSHDRATEYINSNSPSTILTIINVIHGDVCDIFFYGEEVLEYKVQFNKTFNHDDIIKTTENKAIFHNLFKNANLVDYPDQASKLSEIDSQTYFYQARMSNEMYEPKGHNKYSNNSIDDVTKNWEKNVLIHMFSTTNNNNIISINSLRYKSAGSNSLISLDLDVDVGIHNL